MTKRKTEIDHITEARSSVLKAAMPHVMFDGWSNDTLQAAISDSGVDAGLAAQAFPRGPIDLAAAYHRAGDEQMVATIASTDLSDMKIRERIAFAIRTRLSIADKEAVQKGMSIFALPQNMGEGSRLLWGTSDAIWKALKDPSTDFNWYSKRTILSGVYSSTVLYWLGDTSEEHSDTWSFLDRRIENVMQIEKAKSGLQESKLVQSIVAGPLSFLNNIKAPDGSTQDLPGFVSPKK